MPDDAPGPASPPRRGTRLLTSPALVFPVLALALLATLLLSPRQRQRTGSERLTTYATDESGGQGLYEVAGRLGWRPERTTEPWTAGTVDTGAVYAVLYPGVPPTSGEVHALLEGVRHGAGLLASVPGDSPLSDSLHLRPARLGGTLIPDREATRDCPPDKRLFDLDWGDDSVHLWWLDATATMPDDTVTFAVVRTPGLPARAGDSLAARPADSAERTGANSPAPRLPRRSGLRAGALGRPFGRGRVIVVADPDLLRNDVLRVCRWGAGVTAVRMLEWLSPDGRRRIVFDEFHQGFGRHASVSRATWRALILTAPGRMLSQWVAAALILVLAFGLRPIVPRARERVERRSPLEHVGALARAYERVSATRMATRRMVRGLRRRHAHGAWRAGGGTDEEFLAALAARHPALAPQIRIVLDATRQRVRAGEFLAVGQAIDHIERTLSP